MARPKPAPSRRSPVKMIVLVIVCSLIGGTIVYRMSDRIRGLTQDARASGLIDLGGRPAKKSKSPADKTDAALAKMKRSQLESEVARLREDLAARDRENADLKIQLKLSQEGSRTAREE